MFREDERDMNEEYEEFRHHSKSHGMHNGCMPPCYSTPYQMQMPDPISCPMHMQMPNQMPCHMQMPQYESHNMKMPCHSECDKSKKWRDEEDFEALSEEERAYYAKPYYPPYYHNPQYHYFHHHYHHYPHGPMMVKRDIESEEE